MHGCLFDPGGGVVLVGIRILFEKKIEKKGDTQHMPKIENSNIDKKT